jgi:hypothetical protein
VNQPLAEAVERVRRKLLDLSLRNPLLSFPERRTKIRVIAENPDQLFCQLPRLLPPRIDQRGGEGKPPTASPPIGLGPPMLAAGAGGDAAQGGGLWAGDASTGRHEPKTPNQPYSGCP